MLQEENISELLEQFKNELKLIEDANRDFLLDRQLSDFYTMVITPQEVNINFTEELIPEIKKEILNLFIKYFSEV